MSFKKWDHEFDGAFTNPNSLKPAAGVYVIWCDPGKYWIVLDVGESENVVERIKNHDRADCWRRNCSGNIYYSATYISDQTDRIDLEYRIRSQERVACGEE